jgi:hypothetical protein
MKIRIHHEKMADDLRILDACIRATKGKMDFMVDANQPPLGPAPERGVVWDFHRALQTTRELKARGVDERNILVPTIEQYDLTREAEVQIAETQPQRGLGSAFSG